LSKKGAWREPMKLEREEGGGGVRSCSMEEKKGRKVGQTPAARSKERSWGLTRKRENGNKIQRCLGRIRSRKGKDRLLKLKVKNES